LGLTPLHVAAGNGHLEVVQLLVERGANVSAQDVLGWTPLHVAAGNGHSDVVEFLIGKGVDVNAKDRYGRTPLHYAALRRLIFAWVNIPILLIDYMFSNIFIKYLLVAYYRNFLLNSFNKEKMDRIINKAVGMFEFLSETLLCWIVKEEHLKIAELLIEKGAAVDATDVHSNTPLHLAAFVGNLNVARLLIEKGADVNKANAKGWTPLHVAAYWNHLDVAKLLIEKGANVNARIATFEFARDHKAPPTSLSQFPTLPLPATEIDSKPSDAVKPTTSTVEGTEEPLSSNLLALADISKFDSQMEHGMSPLHVAAIAGSLDVAKLLIECGANVNARDERGSTPLHALLKRNYMQSKSLNSLLSDIVKPISDVFTTEISSRILDISTIISDLPKWFAGFSSKFSKLLHSLISIMKFEYYLEIAKILIDRGGDVNAKDRDGNTPLHYAVGCFSKDYAKLLIDKNADVYARNNFGLTPLHVAVREGRLEISQLLIENGADVDAKDEYGWTPLHWAVKEGHQAAVSLLIGKGADVNARNDRGWTPLHVAAFWNRSEIAVLLLENGANPAVEDSNGKTPEDVAIEVGNYEIAATLKRWQRESAKALASFAKRAL